MAAVPRRSLPLAALVLLGALALAGCSSSSGGANTVSVHDFKFEPASLTVKAGAKVTFANHDSTTHTATADGGAFDTHDMAPGTTHSVTLSTPGTYTYHCAVHPEMTGTIVVQ
jgi:plastocyanin